MLTLGEQLALGEEINYIRGMPRILYIVAPETDYQQDMVFAGLVDLLGAAQVRVVPFNIHYHWARKPYPRNLGRTPNWPLLDLRRLGKFEPTAVVVASCKPKTMATYLELLPKLPQSIPHVFLDGGDWPALGGDLERLGGQHLWKAVLQKRPFDLIFKREKLIAETYAPEVVAFPFCVRMDLMPEVDTAAAKPYDVSFWAVESHPIRTQALQLLENNFDCKANGTTLKQVFSKYKRKGIFYLEELSRCRVVLNLRGAGHDTLRYWEVPALKTCMVSTQPPIEIPNNYQDNEHVIFIKDDLSDMIPRIEMCLADTASCQARGQAAYAHTLAHHTHIHRARYLLDFISRL